jgi:hypothetical protein
MEDVTGWFEGIHYTLHYPLTIEDINGFYKFQDLLWREKALTRDNTYRLYVDPRIETPLIIKPSLWTRVEMKAWIPEGKCPLPIGETLFILNEGYPYNT